MFSDNYSSYCFKISFISFFTLIVALKIKPEYGDLSKIFAIDALQPEVRLGSLYDRRTDKLFPGLTLWKEESFKEEGFVNEIPSSQKQWFLDSQNTFSSKVDSRRLDIDPGLILSIMGGMVELKGHAKYLSDTSSSRKVAKVSLTFKETTVYRELTSDAIHNPYYKELLTDYEKMVEFTHIVVGIQYGGTCTMVFEREVNENEKKEDIQEALCAILNEIPQTKYNLSVDEKHKAVLSNTNNFRCTVYSDLKSNVSVSNWDDALNLFRSFSFKNSGSGTTDIERGVPVKMRLLPKKFFGSEHDVLGRELSSANVNQIKEFIESLTNAINESRDLFNETNNFPILKKEIGHFVKIVENYKTLFEDDILRNLLKSIRSSANDVKSLLHTVKQHEQSVFGSLNEWLNKKEHFITRLLEIQNQLPADLVSFSNKHVVQNTGSKTHIALVLKVSKREDKFINEMEKYYKNAREKETVAITEKILDEENWIEEESLTVELQQMAYQLKNFASANLLNEKTGFFVREEEYKDKPECKIEVWQKFNRLAFEKSFEPPTEVQHLQAENYSHNAIKIKWNVPEEGPSNVSNYLIEVNLLQDDTEMEKLELVNQVKVSPNLDGKVMSYEVRNLEPGNTYKISVRCLSLNDTAFSKSKIVTQRTRTSYPVTNLKATLQKRRQIMLSWEYDEGKEKTSSFLIQFKASKDTSWQCRSQNAGVRTYTFSDLCFGTYYQFRVQNCYDSEEDTLLSEEVHQTTQPMGKVEIKKVC